MARLTDLQKIEVTEKYLSGDYNCEMLGKSYGVTRASIRRLLKNRNISRHRLKNVSKYRLNQNYFSKIDTEDKAYFLGLMYADGYNSGYYFTLKLQGRDKNIIDKFNKCIDSNRPIRFSPRKGNTRETYHLMVSNKKICNDLIKMGCVRAKSKILTFPNESQVPNHLLRHFLRGMFDGDGCIWISKDKKKIALQLASTLMFNEVLKSLLEDKFNISSSLYKSKKCHKLFRSLAIGPKSSIKKFLVWMYEDSNFYIQRKYETYKEVCRLVTIE